MTVIVMGYNGDVRGRLSAWGLAHKGKTEYPSEAALARLLDDFDVMLTRSGFDAIMWLDTKGNQFNGGFKT